MAKASGSARLDRLESAVERLAGRQALFRDQLETRRRGQFLLSGRLHQLDQAGERTETSLALSYRRLEALSADLDGQLRKPPPAP